MLDFFYFTILIFLSNFFYLLTPYRIYNIRLTESFYLYSFFYYFYQANFLLSLLAIILSKILFFLIEYKNLKDKRINLSILFIEVIPILILFVLFKLFFIKNDSILFLLSQVFIFNFLFYLINYLLIEFLNIFLGIKSFIDAKKFILFFTLRNLVLNLLINLLLFKILIDLNSVLWGYVWLVVLLPIVLIGRNYNWLINAAKLTIENISKIVDNRNVYASNHSLKVAELAKELSIKLNLSYEEVEKIYHAAKIMNIGYISIPEYIFSKNTPLNDNEREIINKHPVIAANILEKLNSYSDIVKIVRHHHENWDGSGYPDKLQSNIIPLGSRIIRICDVFISLINDRAYRKAYSIEEAIKIIKENQNQFDPNILPIFFELIKEKNINK
jgi:HD-GYP domain-containing protein (c-di-GMP phosphodiesterase class II)